jgi:hypothetical protein
MLSLTMHVNLSSSLARGFLTVEITRGDVEGTMFTPAPNNAAFEGHDGIYDRPHMQLSRTFKISLSHSNIRALKPVSGGHTIVQFSVKLMV